MLSREHANELAKMVEKNIPENYGFCVLVFPFMNSPEDNGRMQYISNGNREDIVRAMKEWIAKTEDDNFGKDI